MYKKSVFTLVELLVVITILAILVSLLSPALSRVVFNTKLATCKVNLQTIHTGFTMYADDNNSFFPKNKNRRNRPFQLGKGGSDQSIYSISSPYFSSFRKTFMCPGARENTAWEGRTDSVEYDDPNRDDSKTIATAYNMYFNTSEPNSIWDQDKYQMRRQGDLFSIGPWQGYSNEIASFNFVASDLNVIGGSHIGSWQFRKHRSIGGHYASNIENQKPAYGWTGYEWKNNYAYDDGSVITHYQFFPPKYYYNGWGQKGYIHKNIFVTPYNNGDNHLDIPRELITESNL
jgi:prepilin-type N-terminal cleavage/methylation domain-containing protein